MRKLTLPNSVSVYVSERKFKTLKHSTNREIIEWAGYKWLTRERWGEIHPQKPTWWYDPSCVIIDEHQNLHLKTKYNPKYFDFTYEENGVIKHFDGTSQMGCGLITCETEFLYGLFEVEARLPNGISSWPAIWMYPVNQWPPELDVMEGYGGKRGAYFTINHFTQLFHPWAIETNVHLTKSVSGNRGSQRHFNILQTPTNKFIKFKWEWRPTYIKIYYDDKLVRTLNAKISEQFQLPMRLIFNNGLGHEGGLFVECDFMLKNFKYTN